MRHILAFAFCVLVPAAGLADASTYVVSQQGRLLDGTDQPVSGTHTLTFSFFAGETHVEGETAAWKDDFTVNVTDGLYAVDLGGPGHSALPATVFGAAPVWLEVAVDGTALSPRLRVGAVPVAGVALGVDCQGCVKKEALAFDPDVVQPDAVGTLQLQDGSVTEPKLADGAVSNRALGNGIDGGKLLGGTVSNDALASGIDGAKLVAGSVGNAELAGGLEGSKLAAGSIGNAQLAGGLDGSKLAAGSIGNAELADGLDGSKLAAGSIGNAELASGIDGAKITAGSIGNAELASGIDGAKITAGSVGNAELASGIDGAKLKAGSVPTTALALAGESCQVGTVVQGIDASGNLVCASGTPKAPTLVQRLANVAVRGAGSLDANTWQNVPGMILPFTAAGGPVGIELQTPLNGGSSSSCRSLIDGNPAGLYIGADTTYRWQEGLTYTVSWWRDWNVRRLYPNVPAGSHVLTVQCYGDTATTVLGNSSMTAFAAVVPYGPPSTEEVKAYTTTTEGGQSVGCCSYTPVSGLSLPFTAQGGPVRIELSIPFGGASGSHSTCRPMVDGTPAGQADIDDTTYGWQEGLTYTATGWNMWNRTRLYTTLGAGNHTATVECRTDNGTLGLGNGSMPLTLSVVSYKPASDSSATVKAYVGVERQQYPIGAGSGFVTLNASPPGRGLNNLAFTATGGPVEIGLSIPLESGSHTTCRPLVDGSPVITGEPDNTSYIWQDGLTYSNPGWQQWDQVRMYQNVAAGNHTLSVQCATDGGTMYAGHSQMVSTAWVVAYKP